MASATWNALAQQAATLAKKPVEYAWRWAKGAVKGIANYTWGAIAETFRGVRRWFGRINQGFKDSFPQLSAGITKSKEAIMSVFGAGKEITKGMWNIAKGGALAIGEVFMGPINGLILKPGKENIIKPLEKATNIKILPTPKAKAA